ncbi:MAG TPA: bifunctional DNA-binding transcriptional regulator/O6-methylguanine-DNA methyltransferase Ada [Gammaproteobacteria bacterium]
MSTSIPMNNEQRWAAVRARNHALDGVFVYAVKTTGVFCRPSCPSRQSKRDNTEFFRSPGDAEAAGYRACKRCHPKQQSPVDHSTRTIIEACVRLESAEVAPTVGQLAADLGLSASHLRREFKRLTGVTPREYAAGKRVSRLQYELTDGKTVADAIYEAGFGSSSRVYESADRTLGMTPAEFRDGGPDIAISFAIANSELGLLLVAATDKGVCCIELGNSERQLVTSLSRRFPAARLERDADALDDAVRAVSVLLTTPAAGLSLPLDIRGTAFQRRVWRALQHIPPGSTSTYSEVAAAIGSPKAHRAVARACAENVIAIAIPCHRVVRTDGGLGGYRWGLERKRRLLAREKSQRSDTD